MESKVKSLKLKVDSESNFIPYTFYFTLIASCLWPYKGDISIILRFVNRQTKYGVTEGRPAFYFCIYFILSTLYFKTIWL
jgi:hypothetical protein